MGGAVGGQRCGRWGGLPQRPAYRGGAGLRRSFQHLGQLSGVGRRLGFAFQWQGDRHRGGP